MPRKTKSKTEKVSVKTEEKKEIIPEQKPEEKIEETAIFNSEGELVVDVFETNDHFVVLTAIAGVNIKDLDISVEKDMMVIKGNRQDPHLDPEKRYFYQECYWGPFSRKIVLPENIKTEEAEAQMDKGMLVIKIPKITS